MKKLISVILCFCMVMTFTACDKKSEDTVAGVKYYHYDPSAFNNAIVKLEELADSENSDKIIKLYDRLYDQCVELESLYNIAYIKHTTDIEDEYFDKEQLYCHKTLVDMEDRLCENCRIITNGPSANVFREHIGQQAFDAFHDYDTLSSREKELIRQEQKLVDSYYDACGEMESHGIKFKGETWTMDDFMGDRGNDLALSDFDDYQKLYYKLNSTLNKETGPIFIRLVKIRDELAEINGFDNYADYADKYLYSRDYSSQDLQQLYSDVQKVSRKYNKLYYESLSLGMEPGYPVLPESQMLKYLQKYSGKISSMAGRSCKMLMEDDLYDIGEGPERQETSYTTVISNIQKPYICITMNHQDDFANVTHEFGHFVQFNVVKQNNILTDEENYDLAEIASNGYEGLMIHYYDEIFGQEADPAIRYALSDQLSNVIDGCLMDEFQREVYANPDMNLNEVNRTYSKVAARYDEDLEGDPGYNWVYVPHNFESPLYYISYTTSALASLQIWNQSQHHFHEATKTWEKITKTGSFNKEYLKVIDECGLIKFNDDGAAITICRPALKAIEVKTEY